MLGSFPIGSMPLGAQSPLDVVFGAVSKTLNTPTLIFAAALGAANSILSVNLGSVAGVSSGVLSIAVAQPNITLNPATSVGFASAAVSIAGSFSASADDAESSSTSTVSTTGTLGNTNFVLNSDCIATFSVSAATSTFTSTVVAEAGPHGATQSRRVTVTVQGSGPRFGLTSGVSILRNVNYVGSIWIRTADGTELVQVTPDLNNIPAVTPWDITPEWQRFSVTGNSGPSSYYRFMDLNLPVGVYDIAEVQIEFGTEPGPWINTGGAQVSSLFTEPVELASNVASAVDADLSLALEPIDYTLEGLVVFTGELSVNLGAVAWSAVANNIVGATVPINLTAVTFISSGTAPLAVSFVDAPDPTALSSAGALAIVANSTVDLTSVDDAIEVDAAIVGTLGAVTSGVGFASTADAAISATFVDNIDPASVSATSQVGMVVTFIDTLDAPTFLSTTTLAISVALSKALSAVSFGSASQAPVNVTLNKALTQTQITFVARRILRRLIVTPRTLRRAIPPIYPLASYTPT